MKNKRMGRPVRTLKKLTKSSKIEGLRQGFPHCFTNRSFAGIIDLNKQEKEKENGYGIYRRRTV